MVTAHCSPCGSTGSGGTSAACQRCQGSPRPRVNSTKTCTVMLRIPTTRLGFEWTIVYLFICPKLAKMDTSHSVIKWFGFKKVVQNLDKKFRF